jgi:uncharacterized protein YigA (DUF484 family)
MGGGLNMDKNYVFDRRRRIELIRNRIEENKESILMLESENKANEETIKRLERLEGFGE